MGASRVEATTTEAPLAPWHALVVVPAGSGPDLAASGLLRGQSYVQARCADDECEHGRLPTDRTPPCGCWPQEVLSGHGFGREAFRQGVRARASAGQLVLL